MSTALAKQIRRLATFEPTGFPVISLYLNAQADQHGRDSFAPFLKNELHARSKTYELRSDARTSFDKDVERIEKFIQKELQPSANGVVIFACSGASDFFEVIQLNAPIERHEIYVDAHPHLYSLARMDDQFPCYAAVVADTHSARIFVFGLNCMIETSQVENPKVNRTQVGGWSQARYQRHVENYHLHHAKEVLDVLERVVREERIQNIVIAGNEVVIPILREQLSPELSEKTIEVLRLDVATPERQILQATLESIHRHDAKTDAERVERVIGDYRAGGLAVVGVHDVLAALTNGQVDEVLLSASPDQLDTGEEELQDIAKESTSGTPPMDGAAQRAQLTDEIVRKANQTAANVRFIEDLNLLVPVGGVAASLRYRL